MPIFTIELKHKKLNKIKFVSESPETKLNWVNSLKKEKSKKQKINILSSLAFSLINNPKLVSL